MVDGYDNLIRESTFKEMLSERLVKFLGSFDTDVLSDKEADMYRSVLSIICGVLADIPKVKDNSKVEDSVVVGGIPRGRLICIPPIPIEEGNK